MAEGTRPWRGCSWLRSEVWEAVRCAGAAGTWGTETPAIGMELFMEGHCEEELGGACGQEGRARGWPRVGREARVSGKEP